MLSPPSTGRPPNRRLLSLQTDMRPVRPHPYAAPPSPSPSPTSSPTLGGGPPARRPGPPKRSVSFCAEAGATFALASTTACAALSADKRSLVAPPLERTLSSLGVQGGSYGQRMARPLPPLTPRRQNMVTPPTPPMTPVPGVPAIYVHTVSPPRPSLFTQSSDLTVSSDGSMPTTPVDYAEDLSRNGADLKDVIDEVEELQL